MFITIKQFIGQPDIPFPFLKKSIKFDLSTPIEKPNDVYHIRVITKSGKIFRSKPFMQKLQSANVKLPVYSYINKKREIVKINKNRIIDIIYEFKTNFGNAILPKNNIYSTYSEDSFIGELGGGYFGYGGPFFWKNAYDLKTNRNRSPKWIITNNYTTLKFNGKNEYINFPHDTLPQGAFTIIMDLKFKNDNNQQIIAGIANKYYNILNLVLSNKELVLKFRDLNYKEHVFKSKLKITPNIWQKIKISYNYKYFIFEINNKTSKKIKYFGRMALSYPLVFGGWGKKADYFNGELRYFRVIHR